MQKVVQNPVCAGCQGDQIPKSSTVAENMTLLATSSNENRVLDCSRIPFRKLKMVKRHAHSTKKLINKMFRTLRKVTGQLKEVELLKSEKEQDEPINAGFLIL